MKLSLIPTHHAVLLIHENREELSNSLWDELQNISPAHRFFNQTVLDIDTSRNIITWANTPYNDEKIALISFHTASLPAQNAMLKVIEEPPIGVRFILLTSNKESLIDTVLSRVQEFNNEEQRTKNEEPALEFLSTNYSNRMKLPFIISLLAKMDEEGRKDREAVRNFILSLVEVLRSKKVESKYILETLETASFASDSSASGKALLEYLSLLLPVTK